MTPKPTKLTALILLIIVALASTSAWATELTSPSFADFASNSLVPFLAAGELSLISDRHEASQGAKALVATYAATELLKHTIKEKRPNGESYDSFPSGHTSEAFAMATVLSHYKPATKLPAYAIASVIGWSRVEKRKHYWRDVIAGALLGHVIAKQFTDDPHSPTPNTVTLQWRM